MEVEAGTKGGAEPDVPVQDLFARILYEAAAMDTISSASLDPFHHPPT
jgi:hypothetical protein